MEIIHQVNQSCFYRLSIRFHLFPYVHVILQCTLHMNLFLNVEIGACVFVCIHLNGVNLYGFLFISVRQAIFSFFNIYMCLCTNLFFFNNLFNIIIFGRYVSFMTKLTLFFLVFLFFFFKSFGIPFLSPMITIIIFF